MSFPIGGRRFAFATIVLLAILGLEPVAAWWINRYGDSDDKARAIIWADPALGWKQKPGLNSTLLGEPLSTNEAGWRAPPLAGLEKAPLRILVLGPDSAFGWGVGEEHSYALELERLLRAAGKTAVVLNAGEIGYSSFQGRILAESSEVAAFHPTHILVAYGANDLGRGRIFFSGIAPDSRELQGGQNEGKVAMLHLVSRSAALRLLYKLAGEIRPARVAGPSPAPGLRVPPNDFVANLLELSRLSRALGAKVIFVGTPANLPAYPPLAASTEIRMADRFQQGATLFAGGQTKLARMIFEELMRLEPRWNEVFYYLAAIARIDHEATKARAYEELARISEPLRVHRDVLAYNILMKKTAGAQKAPFVDLYAQFPEADKSAFFLDPMNPSAAGHARIARAILAAVTAEPSKAAVRR